MSPGRSQPLLCSAVAVIMNQGRTPLIPGAVEESAHEEHDQIVFEESSNGFNGSIMVKQDLLKMIACSRLELKKNQIFQRNGVFSQLKRKNEVFYFVSNKEFAVDIAEASGSVYLPLITDEEIRHNLQKIKPEIRKKITTLHLGAVKILLKAYFQEGIDSPIKMALLDRRIQNPKDCILGAARGNLAYGKFMFSVYPKFPVDLKSKSLNQTLTFVHEFARANLMRKGDKIFNISYVLGYALSNSVHSMNYCKEEYIEIEDVFSEIGSVEEKHFVNVTKDEGHWAMNIAKGMTCLGNGMKIIDHLLLVTRPKEIGESSETKEDLRSLCHKVDQIGKKIDLLNSEDDV